MVNRSASATRLTTARTAAATNTAPATAGKIPADDGDDHVVAEAGEEKDAFDDDQVADDQPRLGGDGGHDGGSGRPERMVPNDRPGAIPLDRASSTWSSISCWISSERSSTR